MSDPNARVRRRQLMILGAAVLGVLCMVAAGMFLFEPAPRAVRERAKTVSLTPPGSVEDKEAWRAAEGARNKDNAASIAELQQKLRAQQDTSTRLNKEVEQLRSDRATGLTGIARKPEVASSHEAIKALDDPLPSPVAVAAAAPTSSLSGQKILSSPLAGAPARPPLPVGAMNPPVAPVPRDAIEMIAFDRQDGTARALTPGAPAGPEVVGFQVEERAKRIQHPAERERGRSTSVEFLPAGSFVKVAMLNGIDAPTGGQAQGNPLPMAFQVLDVANLANRYRLDIKDCRFIAAAWGDLSSERTMGRTESLTCIIDGETVEMAVRGQVIGEDGKAGIRGRLVTKQGQLLANALFAGSLSGIGRAVQAASTTTTAGAGGITQSIDPDRVAQAGVGGGVSAAASALAQYYLKAADKLFPVIETDGGRTVEILITKGATYTARPGTRETYRGLLRRSGNFTRSSDED